MKIEFVTQKIKYIDAQGKYGFLGLYASTFQPVKQHRLKHPTKSMHFVLSWSLPRLLLIFLIWAGTFSSALGLPTLLTSSALPGTVNLPSSEMNALFDLYNATNGDGWHWIINGNTTAANGIPWNFTNSALNNPCVDNWQGVVCSITAPFEYYHVIVLQLSSYNLTGTLPASLSALLEVQELSLYENQISGPIPESLSNLAHLQRLLSLYGNYITGPIPNTLGNLTQLQYLLLHTNKLTGTIPSALGDLTQLRVLHIGNNNLYGLVPDTLGNLTQLNDLIIRFNRLVGTIPAVLGALSQLQVLDLCNNELTGTIPLTLGNLNQLIQIDLDTNYLVGTIPQSMRNLTQLKICYLYTNYLTGTIPDWFGYFSHLEMLALYGNQLVGTIPELFSQLRKVTELNLQDNLLNGTLPAWLGDLVQLQGLYLENNFFTGPIPNSFGNLTQLTYFSVYTNELTSTIPDSLGNLLKLQYLDLGANHLSGTIPNSLGNVTMLLDLYINGNKLVGTIPSSFCNLTQLENLFLQENYLTGTIPELVGALRQMQYLSLYSNQLTGTIPQALGNLTQLQYLHLNLNQLVGTVPNLYTPGLLDLQLHNNQLSGHIPTLVGLPLLQVVLLQSNQFTGTLENVFDPTIQLQVTTIVVNNNQLTGTLPAAIFQLKIETFVGTSNCFTGPLPTTAVCDNENMVSYIVDGISSASSCQRKLFGGYLSAYSLDHSISGTIPPCLFQLPNVITLHMSGNGLTGSIPDNIELSKSLTDLSLSNNALTGSIPDSVQLKQWSNLDLSYNKLSGTLLHNFASNGSVGLENNRVSGTLPLRFEYLVNISVLGSNTFSCSLDQSDLPQNDKNRRQYHCGSNSFNILFYLWLGIIAFVAIMWLYYQRKHSLVVLLLETSVSSLDTNLHNTLAALNGLTVKCVLYSVVILLPLYTICGVYYRTQTFKYAYVVSAVYTSGIVPFVLQLLFWFILLLVVAVTVFPSAVVANSSRHVQPTHVDISVWQKLLYIFIPYLLTDCIVVVAANATYVYVAVYHSNALLLVVQTLLSVFKVVWGRWTLPYILTLLTQNKKYGKIQIITQVLVNILNNIAIPCLVVAVVSPNCFYNALVAPPAVTTTVTYRSCTLSGTLIDACTKYSYIRVVTSFSPPFTYNYQCSSSLITYYSPAFVSMCIVSTFVTPLAQYLCQWLYKRATPGSYWYRLLDYNLPRTLKPICDTVWTGSVDTNRLRVGGGALVATLVSTLGLLLTFGVMFPPLCVALAVSMFATVALFRSNVDAFISSVAQEHRDKLLTTIRTEYNSIDSVQILSDSVWVLITVSCWFYTLFLFDTLGDAVGFERAYWVLIVMPLMPLVYTGLCKYFAYYYRNLVSDPVLCQLDVGVGVEMQTIDESSSVVHNILVLNDDPEKVVSETESGHV